jgi:hypothetical protein
MGQKKTAQSREYSNSSGALRLQNHTKQIRQMIRKHRPEPVSDRHYASLCGDYRARVIDRGTLVNAVLFLNSQRNVSLDRLENLLIRVEAGARHHICEFWEACDKGCEVKEAITVEILPLALSHLDFARCKSGWRAGRCTFGIREAIRRRDGNRCCVCQDPRVLEVDHRIPLSRGGSNSWENLWTLCRACNRSKGAKTLEEWFATANGFAAAVARSGGKIFRVDLMRGFVREGK